MLLDNLRLLFRIYTGPARAFSRIIDEGSLLFGAGAVVLVSFISMAGFVIPIWATVQSHVSEAAAVRPDATPSPEPPSPAPPKRVFGDESDPTVQGTPDLRSAWGQAIAGVLATSVVAALVGLALIFVPACILVVSQGASVGSFGVAFRRDYGSLLLCALFGWAAAQLPFATVSLMAAAPAWALRGGLIIGGALAFSALMWSAVRTVFGVSGAVALAAVMVGGFALLIAPMVPFVASPFVLYLAWLFFRGEFADVQSSLGSRRSFKRYLEAATLNPRDAEAHYQLGLLHLQRGQIAEAKDRFTRAIEIDRGELDAHYQLGRLARAEKRAEDAIRHFEEVVKRSERHAHHEVWREIGATYLEAGTLEHARWALEKFVAQREHDPEGLFLLGETLARSGDEARARELFARCVEAVDTMPGFRRRDVARFKGDAQKRLRA